MDNLTIVANAMRKHYTRCSDGVAFHWLDRYTHQALCGATLTSALAAGGGLKVAGEPIICQMCQDAYLKKREDALRTLSLPYIEE